MSEILERLYLGSSLEARDRDWLESKKVTHILNVAKELPEYFPGDFVYKKLPFEDRENFKMCKYFTEILNFLDKAMENGIVLVHCMMGISRSAASVILYLMVRKGHTYASARRFVKARRSFISPNKGFITQLINYEMLNLKREKKTTPLTLRHATIVLTGVRGSPQKIKSKQVDKKLVSEELAQFIKTYIKASSDIDFPKSRPMGRSKTITLETDTCESPYIEENNERLTVPLRNNLVGEQLSGTRNQKKLQSKVQLSGLYKHLSINSAYFDLRIPKSPILKPNRSPVPLKSPVSINANKSVIEAIKSGDPNEPKLTHKERAEFFNSRNTTDSVPKINRQKKQSPFKSLLIDPMWNAKGVFSKEWMMDKRLRFPTSVSKPTINSPSTNHDKLKQFEDEITKKQFSRTDFFSKVAHSKQGLNSQENCFCVYKTNTSNSKVSTIAKVQREPPVSALSKVKPFNCSFKNYKSSGSLQDTLSDV